MVMRACRLIAVTTSVVLGIILATAESVAAVYDGTIVPAFRTWLLAGATLAVIAISTLAVLDRLRRIEDELSHLATQRRAERDYHDVESRLRPNGNITTLYPEEE